jgi:hypothetical protein
MSVKVRPSDAQDGRRTFKSNIEVGKKWVRSVNWEGVFWTIILPIIGLVAAAFTPLRLKTAVWAVLYHVTTGVGITAGSWPI